MSQADTPAQVEDRRIELAIALSQVDEKRGDAARAARRLDEALGKDGDAHGDPRLILARAAVDERRGDWQRAIARGEQLLARKPRSVEALNFVGFVAADHNHDLARTIRRLQAAVVLSPGSGAIIDSLGWAYFTPAIWRAPTSTWSRRGGSSRATGGAASTSATCTRSARSAIARWRPTGARSGSSPANASRASSAIASAPWKRRARPADEDRRTIRLAGQRVAERGRARALVAVARRGVLRARAADRARPYPAPSADALIAALSAQQAAVRGMNARVRATSWLGGERVRATVNMLVERDGHLRFEAEISLQGTVAALATDGTAFSLYDAHKNELSRGPACPANVASLIRIPLAPADVAAVLLGDARPPGPIDPATASVGWDVRRGADVLAIPAREGGTLQFLFRGDGAARTLVAIDRIGTNGAPLWRTAYEDHEAVGACACRASFVSPNRTAASTTASRSSSRTDRSTPRRPPTRSRWPPRPARPSSTSAAAPGPARR